VCRPRDLFLPSASSLHLMANSMSMTIARIPAK
jgi:hypothetical protein